MSDPQDLPRLLPTSEVDRLVAAIAGPKEKYSTLRTNGRYAALNVHGGVAWARWNEAIGLRICDLDMLRREVTLGRLVVNQNGSKTLAERGSKTDDREAATCQRRVTLSEATWRRWSRESGASAVTA